MDSDALSIILITILLKVSLFLYQISTKSFMVLLSIYFDLIFIEYPQ